VFAHRTVLHVPSRSSIRLSKPAPGPRTTAGQATIGLQTLTASAYQIQLWHGDVKLPQESLEGGHAHRLLSSYCVPISPDLAGSQPSSKPLPRWIGHKLRFAFRWYSSLLKRCSPRGQAHVGRNALRTSGASAPKQSAGASLPNRFVQALATSTRSFDGVSCMIRRTSAPLQLNPASTTWTLRKQPDFCRAIRELCNQL